MRYVPHHISRALRDRDEDLSIDLDILISNLPKQDQDFLRLYGEGYSPDKAAEMLGLGNGQRLFDSLIRRLTKEINR